MVSEQDMHILRTAVYWGPWVTDLTSIFSLSDGGTAWLSQESFDTDQTDSGAGVKWKNVARQLKEDLSSIILLSEEELQVSLAHSPTTLPASTVTEP